MVEKERKIITALKVKLNQLQREYSEYRERNINANTSLVQANAALVESLTKLKAENQKQKDAVDGADLRSANAEADFLVEKQKVLVLHVIPLQID